MTKLLQLIKYIIGSFSELILYLITQKMWALLPRIVHHRALGLLKIVELNGADNQVSVQTLDGLIFFGSAHEENFVCSNFNIRRVLSATKNKKYSKQVTRAHAALIHNLIYRFVTEFSSYPYWGRTSNLRVGDTFVDVGAFRGYVSLKASLKVGERGNVVAIESMEDNCKYIKLHTSENGLNNLTLIEKALSLKTTESITFFKTRNQSNSEVKENLWRERVEPEVVKVRNISTTSLVENILLLTSNRVIISLTTNGTELELMDDLLTRLEGKLNYLEVVVPVIYMNKTKIERLKSMSNEYLVNFSYPWASVIYSK